jgi:hypothetical protein
LAVDFPLVRNEASMRTHQLSCSATHGWHAPGANFASADLVLYFGLRSALADGSTALTEAA